MIRQLHQPEGTKHGMCMAVHLYRQTSSPSLYALVGYEDGEVALWDVFLGSLLASRHMHDEPVMAVAVDSNGTGVPMQTRQLVTSSGSKVLSKCSNAHCIIGSDWTRQYIVWSQQSYGFCACAAGTQWQACKLLSSKVMCINRAVCTSTFACVSNAGSCCAEAVLGIMIMLYFGVTIMLEQAQY